VSLGDDVVGGDLLAPGGVQVPRTHAGSSVGGAEGISAIVVVAVPAGPGGNAAG
jgi:hypothetical protein